METPKFLTEKYRDLPGSKPVERAVQKKIRLGEKGAQTKEDRVEAYLDRFETLAKNERGFELLKYKILEKHTTKFEEIPESYWKSFEEEMRRRGEGGDWAGVSEEQKAQIKRQHAESVLTDQRASLEQWVDYLASPDSDYIPKGLKYWIFRNILNLSELVKKKEGDKEYIEFPKRSKGTVKPFPDINHEALAYVVDAVMKKLEGKSIEFEYDIQTDEREAFNKHLAKEDFAKLYAWANELMNPIPEHLLPVTEGEWRKYSQGTDPSALVSTIRGRGTGWCTAGLNTSKTQLAGGDFYVYYSLDDNKQATIPRLAIRMEGHDKIAEDPRGIAYKQNLDPYMVPVLEEKLKEFGPVGESYKKKSADMRTLTEIEKKAKSKKKLNREDLIFLYEVEQNIEGFGYQKDPRVKEILDQRNPREDMSVIFECPSEQIVTGANEINENTRVYIGEWNIDIFKKIRHYPNIQYLYELFPDKKIFRQTLETNPEINSPESAEEALQRKNMYLSDWSKDILYKTQFSKESQKYELVRFTVGQLGFSDGATTQEIYEKAGKIGLELCPAEVGPHLRLQYPGKEWMLIAMEQITDRDGDPNVFNLHLDGGRLALDASYAKPEKRWRSDFQFVFRFRKLDTEKL